VDFIVDVFHLMLQATSCSLTAARSSNVSSAMALSYRALQAPTISSSTQSHAVALRSFIRKRTCLSRQFNQSTIKLVGSVIDQRSGAMTVYIGLIHKDDDSSFGVSFPDLPGHVTAGDTLDEAFIKAHELIALLGRHWRADTGEDMPKARSYLEIKQALLTSDILEDALVFAVSTERNPFPLAAE
jgi:antitoxin HicB